MITIKYFIAFIFVIVLSGCSGPTAAELELCTSMGLTAREASFIKEVSKSGIERIPTTGDSSIGGIRVYVDFRNTDIARTALRKFFVNSEYRVFLSKQYNDAPGRKNTLSIIRSRDKYDILRLQKTFDSRDRRTTEAIIGRLKKWEELFELEITGADEYWVEAEFVTLPPDIKAFVLELTEYCTELLNDGTGRIEDLVRDIQSKNGFYLFFR